MKARSPACGPRGRSPQVRNDQSVCCPGKGGSSSAYERGCLARTCCGRSSLGERQVNQTAQPSGRVNESGHASRNRTPAITIGLVLVLALSGLLWVLLVYRPDGASLSEPGSNTTSSSSAGADLVPTTPAAAPQTLSTAALSGRYSLSGKQTECTPNLCNESESEPGSVELDTEVYTLEVTVSDCPACKITGADWDGSMPIAFAGGAWRASGPVNADTSYESGEERSTTSFAYAATPTAAAVVDGVWTATAISVEYSIASPESAVADLAKQTWQLSGTRS